MDWRSVIEVAFLFGSFVAISVVQLRDLLGENLEAGGIPIGIFFGAAFFTSAWAWLYAMSGLVVKLAEYGGRGLGVLRNFLDIDKKPITSIGWVAMVLVSIGYWGLALARWLIAS